MIVFSEKEAQTLVKKYFNMAVTAKKLTGEYDFNFLVTDLLGQKYILKIADDHQPFAFFDAQVKIIDHLSNSPLSEKFSKFISNNTGEKLTIITKDNRNFHLRLLTYLDGEFLMNLENRPENLHYNLGLFLGEMDKSLSSFYHNGLHRNYLWDISRAMEANHKLKNIKNHENRRIADYFLLQFETEVLPHISNLRHAYLHNDANDTNILVVGDAISGLIDFGDMVYSALINNLAIACTYAMMNQEKPLEVASQIIKGYHNAYPLLETELDLLYYLIAARLCISVTQSAHNASIGTENEHHFASETPGWDLLHKLITINPLKAKNNFRKVCGFEGVITITDHKNLIEKRNLHIGQNLSISYSKKLKIDKAAFQYLYDDQGYTFIDCVNNPSHVGHCHPVVARKMMRQITTLNTNTRYLNDNLIDYAKRLTITLPHSLSVCYFTNSGSEANDLAVRMARNFTKQKDIIVLDYAYHGTSTLAMEMSPYKFDSKGGFGQMPWIHKAINPDQYRGPYNYDDANAGKKYASDVQRIIEDLKKEDKSPAVFICETLLGVGGQIPLPDGYLQEVYQHVRAAGGVCIADEVQVGFGRVGECFWGFELQNVVPDIVVMGKPIGNGHPLAAVVVTKEIADAFNNGLEYFNTFGGNPVSMATGLAVLEVIEQEEMQKQALETGNFLMSRFRELMLKYPIIGDVRGHGLFIGVEFVKNRETLEPDVSTLNWVVEKMKENGFLLSTDGPLHNVLKIKPPMTFNKQNASDLLLALDSVLTELQFEN
jgi:4-aminobutyrate aminotransferase-like enzyme/Ser/Thr protein kinase RdoA (MazF antagonist)